MLPRVLLGALGDPSGSQESLRRPKGSPKSLPKQPKEPQGRPRQPQESPNNPQRNPKSSPRAPRKAKKLPDSPQEGLKSCLGNQLSSNLGKLSFDHYVLRFSHIDHPTIVDFETLVAPQIALFVAFFALNILWMTLATLCTLLWDHFGCLLARVFGALLPKGGPGGLSRHGGASVPPWRSRCSKMSPCACAELYIYIYIIEPALRR